MLMTSLELSPGLLIDPGVRLVRLLGQGGMGSVWVADHLRLGTRVAVKFLAPALAKEAAPIVRFQHEAMSAAQIKSPHVVQVFDQGVYAGEQPYMVMELLEGEDLSQRLGREGPMALGDLAQVVAQTCRALGKAHGLGIVHRDVKPDNIFLVDQDGETFVKVLDFGVAKRTDDGHSMVVTDTGSMIGTPYYMSPEQMLDLKNVDFRADLWSLGVVVYHCLLGWVPFEGKTIGGLCVAIEKGVFEPPSRARSDVTPAIDAWFLRALNRDPLARFDSARAMADAFAAAVGAAKAGATAPAVRPRGGDEPAVDEAAHFEATRVAEGVTRGAAADASAARGGVAGALATPAGEAGGEREASGDEAGASAAGASGDGGRASAAGASSVEARASAPGERAVEARASAPGVSVVETSAPVAEPQAAASRPGESAATRGERTPSAPEGAHDDWFVSTLSGDSKTPPGVSVSLGAEGPPSVEALGREGASSSRAEGASARAEGASSSRAEGASARAEGASARAEGASARAEGASSSRAEGASLRSEGASSRDGASVAGDRAVPGDGDGAAGEAASSRGEAPIDDALLLAASLPRRRSARRTAARLGALCVGLAVVGLGATALVGGPRLLGDAFRAGAPRANATQLESMPLPPASAPPGASFVGALPSAGPARPSRAVTPKAPRALPNASARAGAALAPPDAEGQPSGREREGARPAASARSARPPRASSSAPFAAWLKALPGSAPPNAGAPDASPEAPRADSSPAPGVAGDVAISPGVSPAPTSRPGPAPPVASDGTI